MSPVPSPGRPGRKYRSKKERPCDLCRSRKAQCRIEGNDTACNVCKRLDQQCTFVCAPSKRKRRTQTSTNVGIREQEAEQIPAADGQRGQQIMGEASPSGEDQVDVAMELASIWLSEQPDGAPIGWEQEPYLLALEEPADRPFGKHPIR